MPSSKKRRRQKAVVSSANAISDVATPARGGLWTIAMNAPEQEEQQESGALL